MSAEPVEPVSSRRASRATGVAQPSTATRPSEEQLLDAACRVFAESGLRGASMDALAKSANSTKPTLYAHFGSKDQLYEACLRREATKLKQRLFTTYEQAAALPVSQQVHADMRAFFDYAAAHPVGFRLLFDDQTSGNIGPIRAEFLDAITERVAERVRGVVTRHGATAPTASADLLAAMLVGIAVHGARHALLRHPVDPAQASDLATSLAHLGMRQLDPDLMKTIDETANG